MALTVGLDPSVSVGHRLAADLVNSILDGTVIDDARWVPHLHRWQSSQ